MKSLSCPLDIIACMSLIPATLQALPAYIHYSDLLVALLSFVENKVTCIKYLGVHISDLSWSAHIDTAVSKARKKLGFIYRKYYRNVNTSILTKPHTTLVHLLLEDSGAAWDPYLQKDLDILESVQRLACKVDVCTKDWSASHSDHLYILNFPTTHEHGRCQSTTSTYSTSECTVVNLKFQFMGIISS